MFNPGNELPLLSNPFRKLFLGHIQPKTTFSNVLTNH